LKSWLGASNERGERKRNRKGENEVTLGDNWSKDGFVLMKKRLAWFRVGLIFPDITRDLDDEAETQGKQWRGEKWKKKRNTPLLWAGVQLGGKTHLGGGVKGKNWGKEQKMGKRKKKKRGGGSGKTTEIVR